MAPSEGVLLKCRHTRYCTALPLSLSCTHGFDCNGSPHDIPTTTSALRNGQHLTAAQRGAVTARSLLAWTKARPAQSTTISVRSEKADAHIDFT